MPRIQSDIISQRRSEKTARLLIHEIMNPISSMSLSVETLQLELQNNDKLEILEQSLDKLVHFIKQYANAIRKPSIQLSRLAVHTIIRQCLEQSAKHFDLRQATVDTEKLSDDLYIKGDKTMLQEAFLHIIQNALEASGFENGRIEISSGVDEGSIFIQIRDHGDGISNEDLPYVLDPLFTTKSDHQGLGLTRATTIISAHDAILSIESDQTTGTSAEVRFRPD